MAENRTVGPVLLTDRKGQAIVEALKKLNPQLEIEDRESYVRVLSPDLCFLTRAAVEEFLGEPFQLPSDLEQSMPSFKGKLILDEDEVRWVAPGGDREP